MTESAQTVCKWIGRTFLSCRRVLNASVNGRLRSQREQMVLQRRARGVRATSILRFVSSLLVCLFPCSRSDIDKLYRMLKNHNKPLFTRACRLWWQRQSFLVEGGVRALVSTRAIPSPPQVYSRLIVHALSQGLC